MSADLLNTWTLTVVYAPMNDWWHQLCTAVVLQMSSIVTYSYSCCDEACAATNICAHPNLSRSIWVHCRPSMLLVLP